MAKRQADKAARLAALNDKCLAMVKQRDDEACQAAADLAACKSALKKSQENFEQIKGDCDRKAKSWKAKLLDMQLKLDAKEKLANDLISKIKELETVPRNPQRQLIFTDALATDGEEGVHRLSLSWGEGSAGEGRSISAISQQRPTTTALLTRSEVQENMLAGVCGEAFITFKDKLSSTLDFVNPLDYDSTA